MGEAKVRDAKKPRSGAVYFIFEIFAQKTSVDVIGVGSMWTPGAQST
jgi:hypothetical protein